VTRVQPWSQLDTGTTNGLRHGTELGVPEREEFVTVCVEIRGVMRVRWNSVTTKLSRHLRSTSWPVRKLSNRRNYWVTVIKRASDVNILKFSPRRRTHYTSIPTHPHAHCHDFFPHWCQNCVPWRKPFVVQVSGSHIGLRVPKNGTTWHANFGTLWEQNFLLVSPDPNFYASHACTLLWVI